MSNDVDPTEEIERLGALQYDNDIREYEYLGIQRTPEQMAAAPAMAEEIREDMSLPVEDYDSPRVLEHRRYAKRRDERRRLTPNQLKALRRKRTPGY